MSHERYISFYQPLDCLFKSFFRLKTKKPLKCYSTGLWARNAQVIGGFHTQMASNVMYPNGDIIITLHWRHNECDGISNHQPHYCLLNCLFRRRSKRTSKLHVTGLCAGNSLVTGEFPAQRASNAENVSIGWRHHERTPSLFGIWVLTIKHYLPGIILGMGWAYERWHYIVMSSLVCSAHTQNDPCLLWL